MATPHNAASKGDIAKVVLMPGDPLRAQYIADNYLDNVTQFNAVRNMYGYTGSYEGTEVSVMGSGMGIPSIAIYSWELYNFYDVEAIIRVGSAGGLSPEVKLCDIVLGQGACTDSNYTRILNAKGTFAPIADFSLLSYAADACRRLGFRHHVGNLLSTDVYYNDPSISAHWGELGVLACEMEAAGLYANAAITHKRALAIATVSDLPLTGWSWVPRSARQPSPR